MKQEEATQGEHVDEAPASKDGSALWEAVIAIIEMLEDGLASQEDCGREEIPCFSVEEGSESDSVEDEVRHQDQNRVANDLGVLRVVDPIERFGKAAISIH